MKTRLLPYFYGSADLTILSSSDKFFVSQDTKSNTTSIQRSVGVRLSQSGESISKLNSRNTFIEVTDESSNALRLDSISSQERHVHHSLVTHVTSSLPHFHASRNVFAVDDTKLFLFSLSVLHSFFGKVVEADGTLISTEAVEESTTTIAERGSEDEGEACAHHTFHSHIVSEFNTLQVAVHVHGLVLEVHVRTETGTSTADNTIEKLTTSECCVLANPCALACALGCPLCDVTAEGHTGFECICCSNPVSSCSGDVFVSLKSSKTTTDLQRSLCHILSLTCFDHLRSNAS